jgi:predicted Zn-dependent peptidase
VVDLIAKELKKLAAGEMSQTELERTQGQLIGGTMLGLESSDSWMSHIARNEIYFGQAVSTDEICSRIRAVSRDDVIDLAGTLFRGDGATLTLLGDFADSFQIKNIDMSH